MLAQVLRRPVVLPILGLVAGLFLARWWLAGFELASSESRRPTLAILVAATGAIYLLWLVGETSWRRIGLELGYIGFTFGLALLGRYRGLSGDQ